MNNTLFTKLHQVKRFFTVELQLRLSTGEEMDNNGEKSDSVLLRGTDKAASCYKREISVRIHTNLIPTNYSIGYNVPTCFDCKQQPSSGSYKC